MFVGRNKIYLSSGEDITSSNITYYGDRLKLETKYNDDALFVNPKLTVLFRDPILESKGKLINEARFQFEHNYTEDNLNYLKIKKILLGKKQDYLKNLYTPFNYYSVGSHFIKKIIDYDNKEKLLSIPDYYTFLNVVKEKNVFYVVFYNLVPVIAPPNDFGMEAKKEDVKLILSFRKEEK